MHLVFFSLSNRLVGEAFNIMFQLCGNEVIIKVIALAERGEFPLTHELFSLGMLLREISLVKLIVVVIPSHCDRIMTVFLLVLALLW